MEKKKRKRIEEPIGVGEKLQYLAHKVNDNTVRFELSYPQGISEELMGKAVLAVVQGISVLHSSMYIEKGQAYWKENKEITGADCFRVLETNGNPEFLADQMMLHSVKPGEKCQLQVRFVRGRDAVNVTVLISHLCVDGGDARYLLEKITEAYNLLVREGNTDRLELKNGSRSAFQVYDDLSRKEILKAMKAPGKGQTPSAFPFPDKEAGERHLVKYELKEELVKNLKRYGKSRGVTLNDLLLTAFYRTYLDLPQSQNKTSAAIMSMMDLRRHRKSGESDGLANMSGMMPTQVEKSVKGTFEETLAEIAAQTKAAKEDPLAGLRGIPLIHMSAKLLSLGYLSRKMGDGMNSASMGMTNLGNIPVERLTLAGIEPTSVVFGGPLKRKPSMQIAVVGANGCMTLCTTGEFTEKDAVFIKVFMEKMGKLLQQMEE